MSERMQMRAEPRLIGPEEDVAEIRRLHREWWAANHGLDIPRMAASFAPDYLMWNLNSHPYYGLDEKIKLWEHYGREIDVPEPVTVWDLRITADGDMGYVTCEGILPIRAISEAGTGASAIPTGEETVAFRFRETSVYRRDDGEGGRAWRMWHFHCSTLAPEDEPRPGFDDTWTDRGGDNGGAARMT
jgi:ketosteroid isomerase-like protein